MKLLVSNILSKIYNGAFKRRINEFVYLLVLSSIVIKILKVFSINTRSLFLFLVSVSGVLCITTIRASNNTIYSIITKHISMNIKDSSQYHELDYYDDRNEIAQIFKEEFIEGLICLSITPFCKKIRLTTHKWIYDEVICNDKIQKIYEVEVKQSGNCKIPQEVLLLNSNKSFIKNQKRLNKTVFQERIQYKITLKRK